MLHLKCFQKFSLTKIVIIFTQIVAVFNLVAPKLGAVCYTPATIISSFNINHLFLKLESCYRNYYDVFLLVTCSSFTDHLHNALSIATIDAFSSDIKVQRKEDLRPKSKSAIKPLSFYNHVF